MITADNITDEQIRELRDSTFAPPGNRVTLAMHELRHLCDLAKSSCLECERGLDWTGSGKPCENCGAWDARARCASILNARAASGGGK